MRDAKEILYLLSQRNPRGWSRTGYHVMSEHLHALTSVEQDAIHEYLEAPVTPYMADYSYCHVTGEGEGEELIAERGGGGGGGGDDEEADD